MAQTQIADVVVPAQFTQYQLEQSLTSTALYQSGALVPNALMQNQLAKGSNNFVIPMWNDPASAGECDITSDNPAVLSVPLKVTAYPQKVSKAYLHISFSAMSLASELAGADALALVNSRLLAYWDRQYEQRLLSTLRGVLYDSVTNHSSDLVVDISGGTGSAANFSGSAVIDTALTLGDQLGKMKSIAMHSKIYGEALKNEEVVWFKPSENDLAIPTYKGMSCVISDDLVTSTSGVYITILLAAGAIGFGVSEPEFAPGTELARIAAAGNGAGQDVLHSRNNVALHPLGMSWTGAAVAGESPTQAELANGLNWSRAASQRKSLPLAFLISK